MSSVEIYSLSDPRDGAVRYIGKARNAAQRLTTHLRDAKRRKTPVYEWISELCSLGMAPLVAVVERCGDDDWPDRERALIGEARARGDILLNVAAGGNEPFCSMDVRRRNGPLAAKARVKTPEAARINSLKHKVGVALRGGYASEDMKAKLREAALKRPELFGLWAGI